MYELKENINFYDNNQTVRLISCPIILYDTIRDERLGRWNPSHLYKLLLLDGMTSSNVNFGKDEHETWCSLMGAYFTPFGAHNSGDQWKILDDYPGRFKIFICRTSQDLAKLITDVNNNTIDEYIKIMGK